MQAVGRVGSRIGSFQRGNLGIDIGRRGSIAGALGARGQGGTRTASDVAQRGDTRVGIAAQVRNVYAAATTADVAATEAATTATGAATEWRNVSATTATATSEAAATTATGIAAHRGNIRASATTDVAAEAATTGAGAATIGAATIGAAATGAAIPAAALVAGVVLLALRLVGSIFETLSRFLVESFEFLVAVLHQLGKLAEALGHLLAADFPLAFLILDLFRQWTSRSDSCCQLAREILRVVQVVLGIFGALTSVFNQLILDN